MYLIMICQRKALSRKCLHCLWFKLSKSLLWYLISQVASILGKAFRYVFTILSPRFFASLICIPFPSLTWWKKVKGFQWMTFSSHA